MRTLIGQDFHIPYNDVATCSLFEKFIRDEKPDQIILPGDIIDLYSISSFDKDPSRADTLQKDINHAKDFLKRIRRVAGDVPIIYTEGNHEDRLRRYLWKKAPELASLTHLTIPRLLDLADLDIGYTTDGVWVGDLFVYHGSIVRKDAGYAAKAEYLKNGCSGISGHGHRDGKYSVRHRGGQYCWWENFCLCLLDPEYIKGVANWSQGWSLVTTIGSRPYVEQIPIINHKYIYGGRLHE